MQRWIHSNVFFCLKIILNSFCAESYLELMRLCEHEDGIFLVQSLSNAAVTCSVVDYNFLISGSDDCTCRVWDLCTGLELCCYRLHNKSVKDLVITPAGFIISCSSDQVLIWNYSQGAVVHTYAIDEICCCLLIYNPSFNHANINDNLAGVNAHAVEKLNPFKLLVGTEAANIICLAIDDLVLLCSLLSFI